MFSPSKTLHAFGFKFFPVSYFIFTFPQYSLITSHYIPFSFPGKSILTGNTNQKLTIVILFSPLSLGFLSLTSFFPPPTAIIII